jgi:hypothetical protein
MLRDLPYDDPSLVTRGDGENQAAQRETRHRFSRTSHVVPL